MSANKRPNVRPLSLTLTALAAAASSAMAAGGAPAPVAPNVLPTGGTVAAGQASIRQSGSAMTVQQGSDKAILNWNTFSIGSQASVTFQQPGTNSVVLNRVASNEPSQLLGTLSGNGKVWIINPAGIMVGQGAQINLQGFVASSLAIRDDDFLAGRMNFRSTPDAGPVVNRGSITTPSGGSVYLVAPNVENSGVIRAPNGEVILAAGQSVELVDTATPGVKVEVTGAAGDVTNLGQVVSEAGRIGMVGVIVKNSGKFDADSLVSEGGRIFLRASKDAYVSGNGVVSAVGTKGGAVEVLGERVAVIEQASIDASGSSSGGSVLVGGDFQGGNAAVRNAQAATIGSGASLRADATGAGRGGKVIVWSDDLTQFYGKISARGGKQSGDGGFVETSGKRQLISLGSVDASAPFGTGGSWLLDPHDITIGNAGTVNMFPPDAGIFASNADSAVVNAATLSSALSGGTSVVVRTSAFAGTQAGDITVDAPVIASGNATLTLNAQRNIAFTPNGSLGNGGSVLNVNLNAGMNGATDATNIGNISMAAGSSVTTGGGYFSASAPGAISLAAVNTVGSGEGSVVANAGGALNVNGPIAASTGISLTAGTQLAVNSASITAGNFISAVAQTGNVTVDAGSQVAVSPGGSIDLQAPSGYIEAAPAVFSGAVPTRTAALQSPSEIAAAQAAAEAAAKAAEEAAAKAAAEAAAKKAAEEAAAKAAAEAAAKAADEAAAKAAAEAAARAATEVAATAAAAVAAKAATEEAARQAAEIAAKAAAAANAKANATIETPKVEAKDETDATKTSGSMTTTTTVITPTMVVLAQMFESQTVGGGDNSFGGNSTPPVLVAPAGTSSSGLTSDTAKKADEKKDDKGKKDDKKAEDTKPKVETKKLAVCK